MGAQGASESYFEILRNPIKRWVDDLSAYYRVLLPVLSLVQIVNERVMDNNIANTATE